MKNAVKAFCIVLLLTLLSGCDPDPGIENLSPNIVSNSSDTNIQATFTSLEISGLVEKIGNNELLEWGICWSPNPQPTIEDDKQKVTTNMFTTAIDGLDVGAAYHFRIYATTVQGTTYGPDQTFGTLSLENTTWKLTTKYPPNNFELHARVDFYEDQTTRYDEMDFPMHCPGCYITFGSWSIEGDILTYIWESSDPDESTYVFTGKVSGLSISGTYDHKSLSDGEWTAVLF